MIRHVTGSNIMKGSGDEADRIKVVGRGSREDYKVGSR